MRKILGKIKRAIFIPYFWLKKNRILYLFFRRVSLISKNYGFDRGKPIDRYYIEKFLGQHALDIRGACLEIRDNTYTSRFGAERVTKSDILDIDEKNEQATIYGDLRDLKNIADSSYDCVILTQVLQFINDTASVIKECYRILRPGGVILATLPSLSRIDCVAKIEGDCWRFTAAGVNYLFKQTFKNIEVESYGNALIGAYFFLGFAQKDLRAKHLNYQDQNFPCIITVRAVKL